LKLFRTTVQDFFATRVPYPVTTRSIVIIFTKQAIPASHVRNITKLTRQLENMRPLLVQYWTSCRIL